MSDYQAIADQAANKYNIPTNIFSSLIATESNWNPFAMSSKGAVGLGQIMPSNWASLGITNPYDPTQNLNGSANLLSQMYKTSGNWYDALRQYNQGNIAVTDPSKGVAYANKVYTGANMTIPTATDLTKPGANSSTSSFWTDPIQYLTNFLKSSAWFVGGVLVVLVLLYFGVQQVIKE